MNTCGKTREQYYIDTVSLVWFKGAITAEGSFDVDTNEAIEAKIEKLLRMADGMANENESAVALQMAQKLADLHNLDLGQIGKTGARKDSELAKGLYQYQRTLYTELAKLNHCRVWISKGLRKGEKYKTRLLGSKMNVTVVCTMADYLEDVTNRYVRDNFDKSKFFSADAHAYRHGMIDRLVERVKVKRAEQEAEREREKREQEARMRHPGAATENAIVLISDVAAAEEKANYDYLNGEGSWDRLMEVRRRREIEAEERLAKRRQWELDNAEEHARQVAAADAEYEAWRKKWAKQAERNDRAAEKRRQERINRYGYDPEDYKPRKETVADNPHYHRGHRHAEDINLDDQIDEEKRKGIQ